MKANPLDQLKRICGQLLSRVANLNNSFKSFFTETMICYLSITRRVNFSQMARYGDSCESRFRQNFKKTQTRKIFFSTDLSLNGEQIYSVYRSRFQIEFLYRDGKQFTGLTDCQARNENSLDFAFNASLTAVNIAKAFAKESGLNLSVESVKLLIHNAVVIQRVLSMSGKRPNLNLDQENFKELLFYGVKTAA